MLYSSILNVFIFFNFKIYTFLDLLLFMIFFLRKAHADVQKLDKELSTEKTLSRRRHGLLVSESVCPSIHLSPSSYWSYLCYISSSLYLLQIKYSYHDAYGSIIIPTPPQRGNLYKSATQQAMPKELIAGPIKNYRIGLCLLIQLIQRPPI